ncbi:hypothetical protein [Clostridium puniceum]|nr:hypothetical protein [Clostridium puniceum]
MIFKLQSCRGLLAAASGLVMLPGAIIMWIASVSIRRIQISNVCCVYVG